MKRGISNAGEKIGASHLERAAYVYVRQSSPGQVEKHKEGRLRQYQLADWTAETGWPKKNTVIIDDDQGKSGASPNARSGFSKLVSAVGRGEVGIVVALEVTRLARNSPDWHNLIFMCRWTDTLIADGEMIYDPSQSNDRMILGRSRIVVFRCRERYDDVTGMLESGSAKVFQESGRESMTNDDRTALLKDIGNRLREVYGRRLQGLVLYGSECRGDASLDSDIDILVLLEGPVEHLREHQRMLDAIYDLVLEIERPIHLKPVDYEVYQEGEYPLYETAKREGVLV